MARMPFPEYTPTVPEMLRRVADRYEDRELIVCGDHRLTYRELERESAHIARGLLASGVKKATRVAIIMPDSPDWALTFFAVTRIGALAVPLSTLYQPRELRWVLRYADVDTLCMYSEYRQHDYTTRLEQAFPSLEQQTDPKLYLQEAPHLRSIRVWGECDRAWASGGFDELKQRADEVPAVDDDFLREVESEVTPADLAIMVYTSGSSAEPKGVVHTHGTIVRHSHDMSFPRPGHGHHRDIVGMPFFWVGGLNICLLVGMHGGTTLFCPLSSDPLEMLKLIQKERITRLSAWATQQAAVRNHPRHGEFDLSSLGQWAGPLADEDGNPIPPERQPNSLGMTESFGPHTRGRPGMVLSESQIGSFGVGVDGVEHKIIDPETGEELPNGQEGELCIRGYSLMAGLYKKEHTEGFDRDGFYHTGDSCILDDDGHLYFKGRRGEMVKTRGANVAPREVELVLESFDDVQEAAVLGLPDAVMEEVLVGVVVPMPNARLSEEELKERLRKELSSYKVPRKFLFCRYEDIPRTDSNKPHKRKLKEGLREQFKI